MEPEGHGVGCHDAPELRLVEVKRGSSAVVRLPADSGCLAGLAA